MVKDGETWWKGWPTFKEQGSRWWKHQGMALKQGFLSCSVSISLLYSRSSVEYMFIVSYSYVIVLISLRSRVHIWRISDSNKFGAMTRSQMAGRLEVAPCCYMLLPWKALCFSVKMASKWHQNGIMYIVLHQRWEADPELQSLHPNWTRSPSRALRKCDARQYLHSQHEGLSEELTNVRHSRAVVWKAVVWRRIRRRATRVLLWSAV